MIFTAVAVIRRNSCSSCPSFSAAMAVSMLARYAYIAAVRTRVELAAGEEVGFRAGIKYTPSST